MTGIWLPEGYRFLEKGAWFKPSVDLYSRDNGSSWIPMRMAAAIIPAAIGLPSAP